MTSHDKNIHKGVYGLMSAKCDFFLSKKEELQESCFIWLMNSVVHSPLGFIV